MRIDKINENQFRCYLSREEMQRRKIHLKELAYGTDKAKELFHEMMQEAYARYGFTADNMPVMIEAVPLQDDSLVLTVTKVENPEELDTRFSSFAPFVKSGDAGEVPHSSPLEQLLESIRRNLIDDSGKKNSSGGTKEKDGVPAADNPDAGTIAGVRNADNRDTGDRDIINRNTADRGAGNRNAGNRDTEKQNAGSRDAENRGTEKRDAGNRNAGADKPAEVRTVDRLPAGGLQLYTFPSLGKAVDAAALASPGFRGKSSLYRDPAASMYYLFLTPEPGTSAADYNGVLTILSEFGTARAITPAREQHLREHCVVLCAGDALQQLARLAGEEGT